MRLLVLQRLAEYSSGDIDAAELLAALRTDPLVQKAVAPRLIAVASCSSSRGNFRMEVLRTAHLERLCDSALHGALVLPHRPQSITNGR